MKKLLNASFLTRRDFLKLATVAGGSLLASCSGLPIFPSEPPTPTKTPANTIPPILATPLPTQATPQPTRPLQNIKNIIVLIQENHSFDSLFAEYPGANGQSFPIACPTVIQDKIYDFREPTTPFACTYRKEDVPNYWNLAQSFALCDNYYTEVKGASCANFLMLIAAQTPILEDPTGPFRCPDYCIEVPTLVNQLDKRGFTWHDYGGIYGPIRSLTARSEITYNSMGNFKQDAAAGNLQNIIWINSFLVGGDKTSGHVPAKICDGENFAVDIINAVMNSQQWPSTLLFLVWDEWGGFYDHVTPPLVESLPDGSPFRFGNRVPCIVVSPFAKPGFVSHTQYSHSSILQSIETIFDLDPLNDRDGQANSMLDCLDFTQTVIEPGYIPLRDCGS